MSRFAFFFSNPSFICRYISPPHPTDNYLCDSDELGNPPRLPAGLGDLPLYAEEDGWYSVLGPWNGTTDNSERANLNAAHQAADLDIPIPPVNPRGNAHSDPTLIFCEYHKCSGNRLVALPLFLLYFPHIILDIQY